MNDVLFMYLENVVKRETSNIIHIEDTIEMSPTTPGVADSIYSLYKVEFKDNTINYFILSMTGSAAAVLEATLDLIKDLFTEYYDEHTSELQDHYANRTDAIVRTSKTELGS